MKTVSRILFVIFGSFLLFLVLGRFYLSLSDGWYAEIYPNRFSVNTSAALFLVLPVLLTVFFYLVQKHFCNHCSGKKIIALLSVLTIIKLILFAVFYTEVELASDYKTYYLLADAISKGSIVLPDYIAVFPHVIGYPYILSIVFRVFGSSVKAGLLFNLLLSCASIWIIYQIGQKLHSKKTGLLASAFYIVLPSSTMYCYLLCSEFAYQFVLLTIVLIFLYLLNVRNTLRFFGLSFVNGVLLALLSAIRPNGLILLISLIIITVLFIKNFELQISRKILIPGLCCIYILTYLLTSEGINICIENTIGTGIAENRLGWNLYVGLNQDSYGFWNKKDADLFGSLLAEKDADEAQSELYHMAIGRLKQINSVPEALSFLSQKTLKMWSHDHEVYTYVEGAIAGTKPWWMKNPSIYKLVKLSSDVVYYIIIYIIVLGFITMSVKKKSMDNSILVFALYVLGSVALHIPFEAASRYHNPCLVPLCILAAYCAARSEISDLLPKAKTE